MCSFCVLLAASQPLGYDPSLHVKLTLKLSEPFPTALTKKTAFKNGSIHASSILGSEDEEDKDTLRIWFLSEIAATTYFEFPKPSPSEHRFNSSTQFKDYSESIEELGYKVWDIQNSTGETASIILEDSTGKRRKLSCRADFIITSNDIDCRQVAPQHALCVVEKQSGNNDEECEHQLVTYLVIMMNAYGLESLSGILVYNNATCRAYRASRGDGDPLFEQNDTFDLDQIAEILPELLKR